MNQIDKDLPEHICKTCINLTYWDGYWCKLGKHQTKKEKLSKIKLKKCDGYKERKGSNWDSCKEVKCVFWCMECEAYKKYHDTSPQPENDA